MFISALTMARHNVQIFMPYKLLPDTKIVTWFWSRRMDTRKRNHRDLLDCTELGRPQRSSDSSDF